MSERTEFRSLRLDPAVHDLGSFVSGESELDDWLSAHAVPADRRGTARTWVWVDDEGSVVAYYSLVAHKVARERVPGRIGRGGPVEIPAVLIAKLALSSSLQGRGLGKVLVVDALDRVLAATAVVAARVVVVDALSDEVAGFSEHLGFSRIPGSRLLVQKVSDIAAALRDGDAGQSASTER